MEKWMHGVEKGRVGGWMDAWRMNGCMGEASMEVDAWMQGGWMDGCMVDGWMDGCMDGSIHGDGCMDAMWMDGWMHGGWMDGCMVDGWMDGGMDAWMHGGCMEEWMHGVDASCQRTFPPLKGLQE